MKMNNICVIGDLMVVAFLGWTAVLSAKPSVTLRKAVPTNLQPLLVDKDFEGGCGCSVVDASGNTIFFSDIYDKAPGIIKVTGKKHELRWVSTTANGVKKGDHFTRVYSKGELKLQLEYTVTFVCEKNDEGCEVTRYQVNYTFTNGKVAHTAANLNGDCGC